MNRNQRFVPMRAKMALGFILMSMFAIGLTAYIYYQNTKAILDQDIRERLRDSVAIAALQVNGDLHAQLTDPSQEGSPTYLQLKETLQKVRDASTNIAFVYTMRQDAQGNVVFIVDAEESEEDVSHLGDIYDSASPWLKKNFTSIQGPVIEDKIYHDEWGDWLTGYAPIYTSDGRRDAILGMDIAAADVIAREEQALTTSLFIFFGSILPVALLGWLFGIILTRPIIKLMKGAELFSAGDFSHRVEIVTNDEIGILGQAFNTTATRLGELVARLEQRVDDRTNALTRRTSQLQASAQVARQAAAIKDTPTLLNDAVRLISDQFGFYHAGIFLLDNNNEYAVLQAASSVGGQRMLARGHRLQVGKQGVVGFSVSQKHSRVALDTGADAVYFDNPDLPNTRSEAALPLIVQESVIGVLDIQSEKPQAFTSEDIEVFQTLADQLALAIENSRLINEMNFAVQQLQQTATNRTRGVWGEISQSQGFAYQYTPLGIQPATKDTSSAGEDGKLTIPISLHNQKIGEIRVKRKEESEAWDSREQNMLEKIASQVALALENARLLDEAQQRAVRERSISEIAARIGSAHDVDAILRVTAQEIGKAIGDSEVIVQIRGQEREA